MTVSGKVYSFIFNEKFDFSFNKIDIDNVISISLSPNGKIGAFFNSSKNIFQYFFATNEKKLISTSTCSSVCFSWFDEVLISISSDGVLSFFDFSLRSFSEELLKDCYCFVNTKSYIFASVEKGLTTVPIIQMVSGSFPILFSPYSIYRTYVKENGVVSENVPFTDLHIIEYVASNNLFALLASSDQFSLYDYSNKSLYQYPNQKLFIRGVYLMSDQILVLHFNISKVLFELKLFTDQNHKNVKQMNSFSLYYPPIEIKTDQSSFVILCNSEFYVYSNGKLHSIKLTETPIHCDISKQLVFILFQSHKLISFDFNGDQKPLAEKVDSFLINRDQDLLVLFRNTKVFILSLDSSREIKFTSIPNICLGLLNTTILSLPHSPQHPFTPILHQFLDISIVIDLTLPNKAVDKLKNLQNLPYFEHLLKQVTILALRDDLGNQIVSVLQSFPDFIAKTLVFGLRAVESHERKDVFLVYSSPTDIFCSLTSTKLQIQTIPYFVAQAPPTDIVSASLFLAVLFEETGPQIGFSAAIFILSVYHFSEEVIDSLFRFLYPLISPPTVIPNRKVSCGGITLFDIEFELLKKLLSETILNCILDLLDKTLFGLILCLLKSINFSLASFLITLKSFDDNEKIPELLTKLISGLNESKFNQKECNLLRIEMEKCGWKKWTLSLFLVGGEISGALKYVETYPTLKDCLIGSQWENLIRK